MRRANLLKGVAAFALVVAVVVASTAAAGTFLFDPADSSVAPSAPAFTSDSLPATPVEDDGTVTAPAGDETKTVVVDRSHANAVEKAEIQPLIDALVRRGHEVRFHSGGGSGQSIGGLSAQSGGSSFNDTLRSADAFVVVNPGSEYTADEIDGVEAFADAGGRVLVLADPVGPSTSGGTSLPVPLGSGSTSSVTPGQPTNLAARFGISFDAGYLFDMDENANNFQSVYASTVGSDPLTAEADRIVLRDAAALTTGPDATALFETETTRLSSTRRNGNYTVAARNGNVTAVGDTDFLASESATVAGNDRFVTNVAGFLVTGERTSDAPAAESDTSVGTGGVLPPGSGNQTNTTSD